MKIGLVSKFGIQDGLRVHANYVYKGLVERGHEVHAFTQSRNADALPGGKVHCFPAFYVNPHFSLDAPDAIRMIARESARHKLDLLHLQMNSSSTEFLLPFFKKSLPPLVVTFHLAFAAGRSVFQTAFSLAWKVSLFASRRYDAIVLVHPFQKPLLLKAGIPEDKITVILNGVDTDVFKPRDYKKKDDVIDFVFVGRLSYDKGVHILLKAFREYHRENPKSRLTLVGDGLLKAQLDDDDSRSTGAIRWLGCIDHKLIPAILRNSDVFVIPQNIGPLTASMSVLEAMSSGLPVITTTIGDADKLLSPSEGVLVEPENVPSVVDAMRLLSEDEKLRTSMGMQCRKKIVREHSWSRQISNLEDTYRQVITKAMG